MKVFISSVIGGFEDRREAVQDAVESLGYKIIKAEDFPASPASPQIACLDGVRQSDLVILVMGQRYGNLQQSGISATHEEFREAKKTKEIFVFIEDSMDREPSQDKFISEVQDWQSGFFTENFATIKELRQKVTKALHLREVENVRGVSDTKEIIERAKSKLPPPDHRTSGDGPKLIVALSGGPHQNLLRPAELQNQDFGRSIILAALHGNNAVFDPQNGYDTEVTGHSFQMQKGATSLKMFSDGSIALEVPLKRAGALSAVIEEDIQEQISHAFRLANELLGLIDRTEKLKTLGIVCDLHGMSYVGWKTRQDHRENPNSMTVNIFNSEGSPVVLNPPVVPRAMLRTSSAELAADFLILLKQQYVSN